MSAYACLLVCLCKKKKGLQFRDVDELNKSILGNSSIYQQNMPSIDYCLSAFAE